MNESTTIPKKQCTWCKEFYPATSEYFNVRRSKKDGLYSWCKNCTHEKEKRRTSTPEYKAKKAQYDRAYRDQHQAKLKAQHRQAYLNNRETRKQKARQWKRDHPEQVAVHNRNREARAINALGHHTINDIRKLKALQRGKCWWCGKSLGKHYHVDHRVPLAKGGSNWPSNLVLTCADCNLKKGTRLPDESMGRLL